MNSNRTTKATLTVAVTFACLSVLGCPKRVNGGGGGGGGNGEGGGIFRYALQSPPTSLDPARVEDGDTIDMLLQVFEGLVHWNEQSEIVGNLAEKWDLSEDGRTYTFHLHQGVKFHNGRELKADDFVYSMTRALLKETLSPTVQTYSFDIVGAAEVFSGKTRELAGVKALDDKTLQITIDKRRPYFLGKLTYPCNYVVCREAIEANGNQFDEKSMIGTGPFRLESYQQGYTVKLAAFRDYHGERPKLAGIERRIASDSNTRMTNYEGDQLDLVDVPHAELARIQEDSTLSPQLKEFRRANVWYLALNQQAFAPFKDRRVRQAFAHAIDKAQVMRLAIRSTGDLAKGIVPPGVPGQNPEVKELAYDPAKAKQLLAQAGYPGGQGFPKLTITYRQGYKHIEDGALAIREDLRKNLGIEVSVQQVEWAQFLKQRENGAMPCYHLRWGADYLDPQNFLSGMLRTGAKENSIGYSNPEFDRLCDQADTEADSAKRMQLYQQAEQIAVVDAPWVVLYHKKDVELHKPQVGNLRDSIMGHLPHVTTTVAR